MKKRISVIASCVLLACTVSACGAPKTTQTSQAETSQTGKTESSETKTAETRVIELGTGGLTMTVPASYERGDITSEDTDETQVAYYASEDHLVDFDIYQWAKAGSETLEAAVNEETAEYGAKAKSVEFNGVRGMTYEAVEESDGAEYSTATYIFENGDFFTEIVFWMDGDDAAKLVDSMVNSITANKAAEVTKEGKEIVLGTSSLKITTPFVYSAEEISTEDTDENQVAYYASKDSKVDFDVYQWAKAEDETLESAASEEAAEYKSEAEMLNINGFTVAMYSAVEESDGEEYVTATYIVEDGNDFIEIVFWLDGDNAENTVDTIISSLSR